MQMCAQKWTTKKVKEIGHSAWYFRKKFASPSPPRQKNRNQEYRADPYSAFFSQNRAENFFSSNSSIWVPKNAEFYADSKSEDKIKIKCTNKKLFLKN